MHSAGTPNRLRRGESTSGGRGPFISQTSSVTEAPSDEVEQEQEADDDVEPPRVTSYVHLSAITNTVTMYCETIRWSQPNANRARSLCFVCFVAVAAAAVAAVLKVDRRPPECDPSDTENQIFCGSSQVPAGAKTVRCARCHRTILTGSSEYDGEDQGEQITSRVMPPAAFYTRNVGT